MTTVQKLGFNHPVHMTTKEFTEKKDLHVPLTFTLKTLQLRSKLAVNTLFERATT